MSSEQLGSLVYLGLLGAVLGGYFFVANRRQMGKLAQQAAIWIFIFLGAIVAVGLWNDIRDDIAPRQSVLMEGGRIEVPRAGDGHYYLTLAINGVDTRFVVDTGASEMVLTQADAARAGLKVDQLIYSGRAMTANGMVETAPVVLDSVGLGGVSDSGVRALVNRGEMSESLLGMSYLGRFERLEIIDGTLALTR